MSLLEVEEKFQVSKSGELEPKLRELGFIPKDSLTFVDWYYDTKDNYLTTRDCWLRYRESGGKGEWQTKIGRGQNSSTTVYEETEGDRAITAALSLLPEISIQESKGSISEIDGFRVPVLPVEGYNGLAPFCRLETTRSSWIPDPANQDCPYRGLHVDLDETNTGHAVGEVETVVSTESQIAAAKQRVQGLISKLTRSTESDTLAVGKLEHFLINNRPEHYEACVQAGVIEEKRTA